MFGLVRTILLHRKPLKSTLLQCGKVFRGIRRVKKQWLAHNYTWVIWKKVFHSLFGFVCAKIYDCYECFVTFYLTGELWFLQRMIDVLTFFWDKNIFSKVPLACRLPLVWVIWCLSEVMLVILLNCFLVICDKYLHIEWHPAYL